MLLHNILQAPITRSEYSDLLCMSSRTTNPILVDTHLLSEIRISNDGLQEYLVFSHFDAYFIVSSALVWQRIADFEAKWHIELYDQSSSKIFDCRFAVFQYDKLTRSDNYIRTAMALSGCWLWTAISACSCRIEVRLTLAHAGFSVVHRLSSYHARISAVSGVTSVCSCICTNTLLLLMNSLTSSVLSNSCVRYVWYLSTSCLTLLNLD